MPMSSAPSILYLCDYQAPYGGNFIASMMRLDDALAARGARTCYVFPSGARERDWCGAMLRAGRCIRFLPEEGGASKLRRLLAILDEQGVTILHVHFGLFPLAELAAILRPRLRLILHFHSDFSGGREPTRIMRIRDCAKRLPELILGRRLTKVTVSQGSRRTTKDCVELHNALCETRFVDQPHNRMRTRIELDVPDDRTLALVFGWSPWIKGVDVAVRAVEALHAQGQTQFMLGVVCGRAYPKERMRTFIDAQSPGAGSAPWLRLLPPIEDVFCYHKAADIMISASRSETFSYALLEAICTAKPCVCSDIPGVAWADAFDTVRFFQTENADALASALHEIDMARKDPDFATRLDTAAAHARQAYGMDEWIEGMMRLYGLA